MGLCTPVDARVVELVYELTGQVLVAPDRVQGEIREPLLSRPDEGSGEALALLGITISNFAHRVVIRCGVVYGVR